MVKDVLQNLKDILSTDVDLSSKFNSFVIGYYTGIEWVIENNKYPFIIVAPVTDSENLGDITDTVDEIIEVGIIIGIEGDPNDELIMGDGTTSGLLDLRDDVVKVVRENKKLGLSEIEMMYPGIVTNYTSIRVRRSFVLCDVRIRYKHIKDDPSFH